MRNNCRARSSNANTLSRLENLLAAEGYKRINFLSFLAPMINFEYTIREDCYGNELASDADLYQFPNRLVSDSLVRLQEGR